MSLGPGGVAGVGTGWTNATAWLVAVAVMVILILASWLIAGETHRRGRGRSWRCGAMSCALDGRAGFIRGVTRRR